MGGGEAVEGDAGCLVGGGGTVKLKAAAAACTEDSAGITHRPSSSLLSARRLWGHRGHQIPPAAFCSAVRITHEDNRGSEHQT